MSAKILPDVDSEEMKVLACFDPSLADLNKEAIARKDLRDTLRTWWKAFFSAVLRRNLRDQPFHWNDSFHGYIAGRRREGAMITQRAVSVRLKKEGIQHMTDFEDIRDAFACTSANCRAEVLEELINETDRPMFFWKGPQLHSALRSR